MDLGVDGGGEAEPEAEPGGAGGAQAGGPLGVALQAAVEGADGGGEGGVELVAEGEGDIQEVGQPAGVEVGGGGLLEGGDGLLEAGAEALSQLGHGLWLGLGSLGRTHVRRIGVPDRDANRGCKAGMPGGTRGDERWEPGRRWGPARTLLEDGTVYQDLGHQFDPIDREAMVRCSVRCLERLDDQVTVKPSTA
ncbi:MAG TPA: hypothetical protein VFD49_15140 [Candidatus Dormibacteraeota bacterium]|nr:hypothetical protein [Candidatus Dormibacteraeota bacterium]